MTQVLLEKKLCLFRNTSEDNLNLGDITQAIKKFINDDLSASYTLMIGTDSEIKTDQNNNLALALTTAVAIYRKGYGGRYFWTRKNMNATKTLREKIYQEALLSLEIAQMLVPKLKETLNGQSHLYNLEIHIDVGEHGQTREMIREVVGMVVGSGFVARTKPYSYAASNVADKYS